MTNMSLPTNVLPQPLLPNIANSLPYVFDNQTGRRLIVDIRDLTPSETQKPKNHDLYHMADRDDVMDRLIEVSNKNNAANQVIKTIRTEPPKNKSLASVFNHLSDDVLFAEIWKDVDGFRMRLMQDDVQNNQSLVRRAIFTNVANISTPLATTVYDRLFPVLDDINFKISSWYRSATTYAGQVFNPIQNVFERYAIDSVIPLIQKYKTFSAIAFQEFISFSMLSPAVMAMIVFLMTKSLDGTDIAIAQQALSGDVASLTVLAKKYGLVALLSLGIAPFLVQGIKDGFSDDDEQWKMYFKKEDGELIRDHLGQVVPDFDDWKSRASIVAHSFANGGLVRTAKVVAALFPKEIPGIKDIPVDLLPKSVGDWISFGVELVTDMSLYLAYFGMNTIVMGQTGESLDWGLASQVTAISVLFYCFTAPEIGKKYDKYKATWIRQVFSFLKNPVVMLAGSGVFSDQASLLGITAFSFGLWVWAKYGFSGEKDILQYTGRDSDRQLLAT